MLTRFNKSLLLLCACFWLYTAVVTKANGDATLRVNLSDTKLEVDQLITAEIWIENSPAIYGAESHFIFDPDLLEVVDADEAIPGVQLLSGHFLNPEQGFILQNQADNETGVIDYALTLLNPAPPAEGSGLFFTITFRAKAAGAADLQLSKALFGTPQVEPIVPAWQDITFNIQTPDRLPSPNQPAAAAETSTIGKTENASITVPVPTAEPSVNNQWLLISVLFLVGFSLIVLLGSGAIFMRARQLHQPSKGGGI